MNDHHYPLGREKRFFSLVKAEAMKREKCQSLYRIASRTEPTSSEGKDYFSVF